MAYGQGDKSFGGTPGLLFRQRLEYGIGQRSLKAKRDLLWAMHSEERSMFPQEDAVPVGCIHTLPELLTINDNELKALVKRVVHYGEGMAVDPDVEEAITLLLDGCIARIDEIMSRGKLIENVRPAQGTPLPL